MATGGKFANRAVSAAFAFAFNEMGQHGNEADIDEQIRQGTKEYIEVYASLEEEGEYFSSGWRRKLRATSETSIDTAPSSGWRDTDLSPKIVSRRLHPALQVMLDELVPNGQYRFLQSHQTLKHKVYYQRVTTMYDSSGKRVDNTEHPVYRDSGRTEYIRTGTVMGNSWETRLCYVCEN